MKNKRVQRLLSFALALILCFTLASVKPIAASALAIELGWVTYAIISFMAACGITFTVSGGIEALQSAVEDNWDDFVEDKTSQGAEIIDLADYITFYKAPTPNGSGGNDVGFKFAVAACVLIGEFIQWLQENAGWNEGETVELSSFNHHISGVRYVDGVAEDFSVDNTYIESNGDSLYHVNIAKLGTVLSYDDVHVTVSDAVYMNGITFYNGTYRSCVSPYYYDSEKTRISVSLYRNATLYSTYARYTDMESAGYTADDIVGYAFNVTGVDDHDYVRPSVYTMAVFDDGTGCLLQYCGLRKSIDVSSDSSSSIITIPDTITKPEVTENQSLNLYIFEDTSADTITTPDELGEAVKQQMIDTGSLSDVTSEVVTDTGDDTTVPDEDVITDGTLEGNVSGILDAIISLPRTVADLIIGGFQSMIDNVSDILSQLKALPETLANLILDGVKSIFIPDPDELETMFMDLLEELNDTYSFDFDLEGLFAQGKPPENLSAVYTFGSKSYELTFVDWEYLIAAVEDLRKYIRGFICILLAFFQLRQFMSVLNMVSLDGPSGVAPSEPSSALVVSNRR